MTERRWPMNKNFKPAEIPFKDVNGEPATWDARKDLGNLLYMKGRRLPECELGVKIFHLKKEEGIELNEESKESLEWAAQFYPYVLGTALKEYIK